MQGPSPLHGALGAVLTTAPKPGEGQALPSYPKIKPNSPSTPWEKDYRRQRAEFTAAAFAAHVRPRASRTGDVAPGSDKSTNHPGSHDHSRVLK